MFFEVDISPKERAAARFIGSVRKALLRAAFAEKENAGVTQQSIAEKLGVNRSVINRMLKGESNLTLRSVAEIAWALGMQAEFTLIKVPGISSARTSTSNLRVPAECRAAGKSLSQKELSELLKKSPLKVQVPAMSNDNYVPVKVAA